MARRAAELGKDDALALATAGIALAYVVGELDDAAAFIDQALALNPNLAWAWGFGGFVKTWLGEPEAAIERVTRATRLSARTDSVILDAAELDARHLYVAMTRGSRRLIVCSRGSAVPL